MAPGHVETLKSQTLGNPPTLHPAALTHRMRKSGGEPGKCFTLQVTLVPLEFQNPGPSSCLTRDEVPSPSSCGTPFSKFLHIPPDAGPPGGGPGFLLWGFLGLPAQTH